MNCIRIFNLVMREPLENFESPQTVYLAKSAFSEFGRFRAAKSHKLIVRFALFADIRFFESPHIISSKVSNFGAPLQ